jgi:acetyl/propionyl-CoA carboxylase alpha subunit
MRVLIANRGEIARRIIRTTDAWGVESIAVYADPDDQAPHVREATSSERIGPAALEASYLSIDAILAAARRAAATHVHPGYGFLSEQTGFARAVVDAGLIWVGPSPEAVASMGSKIEARRVAERTGVPVIPGFNDSQDAGDLRRAAEQIGFPVLVKASAGGGGKGIRIANSVDEFDTALSDARTEARRAFGDDDVIVERYITRPRHIEVQIAGDHHGVVIDLGTRECSVQRRYQKVIEEAPAPNLPIETHRAIREAAVSLASAIGYDSVGTVEFIVDAETNEFYFLEMNTRIQVEHTVTEAVTGVDLIALQIAIACGEHMPLAASFFDEMCVAEPRHAFEARINAEDAWNGHLPQTGTVDHLSVPDAAYVRWDAAIVAGSEISPYYDSMIGKLIVVGPDRLGALARLTVALEALEINGVTTNVDFHRWLVQQTDFRLARITTRFLDETPLPARSPFEGAAPGSPWGDRTGRRLTPHRSTFAFESESRDERWQNTSRLGTAGAEITAPFPGLITEILVEVGASVEAGQTLLTIEAMKMLHPLEVSGPTTIATIQVAEGDQVESNDVLMTFVTQDKEVTR